MRYQVQALLLLMGLALLTQGCMSESVDERRVYQLGDRSYSNTLHLFERAYPEIERIQIDKTYNVYDPQESYTSFLKDALQDEPSPDFLMLPYDAFLILRDEGWLAPLDPYLEESDVIEQGELFPSVLEALTDPSDKQLYGLAHAFTSTALIYNKKLFNQAGVPEPVDHMTWDEVFQRARQVTSADGAEPIYGFNFRPSSSGTFIFQAYVDYYVKPHVGWFDADRVKIDQELWLPKLEQFQSLFRDQVIPQQMESGTSVENNLFLSGKLAMSLVTIEQLHAILSLNENPDWITDFDPIDFGIVTAPVHEFAGAPPLTTVTPVLAIVANAAHPQEAWKFIEHTVSFNWEHNAMSPWSLPVNETSFERRNGSQKVDLSAFIPQKISAPLGEGVGLFDFSANELFYRMLNEEITIEQAIRQIELASNAALQ